MTRKNALILLGTLSLTTWLVWRWLYPYPQDSMAPAPSMEKSVQILESSAPTSEEEVKKRLQVAAWSQMERAVRLKRTAVEIQDGEASLRVALKILGACFPGDANAIEMDLKAHPSHKLMATMESLSENGPAVSWDIPKDFLERGLAQTILKLPIKKEPGHFGFYLCTAERSEKSCKDKPAQDINVVLAEHVRKAPNAGKTLRTLFFQYFLLDERGFAAFSTAETNDAEIERLKLYAKERGDKTSQLAQKIDEVYQQLRLLDSLPFAFEKQTITIELPKYDTQVCGKMRKRS